MRQGRVLVGTSGFSYDHWADGVFYPPHLSRSKWLPYYADRFATVELNVTYYRLQRREAFETWDSQTPSDFRFALKGSRLITHYHRLHDVTEAVRTFLERAEPLGQKLEVVLWQLPPRLQVDVPRLDAFCALLRKLSPRLRHSFEFRDRSWFDGGVYRVLEEHGYALCVAHSARWPREEVATAPYVYLRMHGGEKTPDSAYTEAELRGWADKAKAWHDEGRDVYVYFNNDAHGYAVRDAERFRTLAGGRVATASGTR